MLPVRVINPLCMPWPNTLVAEGLIHCAMPCYAGTNLYKKPYRKPACGLKAKPSSLVKAKTAAKNVQCMLVW